MKKAPIVTKSKKLIQIRACPFISLKYLKGVVKISTINQCELCGRDEVKITVHHLVPREYGGNHGETAQLCIPCHKQIHSLFTNAELAAVLNTVRALRENEQMTKYIKWIRKQPSSRLPKIKKSNWKNKK